MKRWLSGLFVFVPLALCGCGGSHWVDQGVSPDQAAMFHVKPLKSTPLRDALRACWDKDPILLASLEDYSDPQLTGQFTDADGPAFNTCMKSRGWLNRPDMIPGP